MEGRGTGTAGAHRAARYIAAEMHRIGLQALGDSGFFQRVPITRDTVMVRPWRQVRDPQDTTKFIAVQDSSAPLQPRVRLRLREKLSDMDTVPAARRRADVNVLGVIRGSDPSLAHEHILVGAHFDHLGIGRPVHGDSIYNGADDDASGVAAVLEIARQLASGPRPARTVVFAVTTGEEDGLLGINWYIAHPPLPLAEMVANLVIELIARPDSLAGGVGKAWLTGFERSTMGDSLAAKEILIVADPRPDQEFFWRSDNIAFARRGIVAHTLSSFSLHADYHQPSDDIAKVDFEHMATVINEAAKAVRLLASGPKPQWKPGGKP
jgi:Zn-dependent M28 family amino/carboxypeptidase